MIHVTYSRERWEELSRRAREKFQNAAGLVEEKTEALRAKARLEQEVRDLQEEIDLQMQAIGEITYAAHKGRPSDSDAIRQILEYVDSLYEQLEAHRQERESAQGATVCSACGAENAPEHLYCHNCGHPLSK